MHAARRAAWRRAVCYPTPWPVAPGPPLGSAPASLHYAVICSTYRRIGVGGQLEGMKAGDAFKLLDACHDSTHCA